MSDYNVSFRSVKRGYDTAQVDQHLNELAQAAASAWKQATEHTRQISDLTAANNLKAGSILQPGQRLIIPSKSGATTAADVAPAPAGKKAAATRATPAKTAETPKPAPAGADAVKYVVKHGDTLAVIARKNGVTQGEIAVANNISNPAMIREGQVLVIPGYVVPGAKSSKAGKSAGAAPALAAPAAPAVPIIGGPSVGPGADAGSAPSVPGNVPVIKIDESAPMTPPKS